MIDIELLENSNILHHFGIRTTETLSNNKSLSCISVVLAIDIHEEPKTKLDLCHIFKSKVLKFNGGGQIKIIVINHVQLH